MDAPMTEVKPPIRKFMFERSFDDDEGEIIRARGGALATFSEEQMDAARKEARDAGLAEGRKAALEEQSFKIQGAVEQIGKSIAKLLADAETGRQQQEARLREAVLAIARMILPEFNRRNGLQEIEAVIAKTVSEMNSEPRLVVRVNETQFDAVDAAVKSITAKQGFGGKVVLLADADVRLDDCRVEWADGGIERNLEALWQNLGKTLASAPEQSPVSSDAAG